MTDLDPWLSLAQRRDEQLVELEQLLQSVGQAAMSELLAGMWQHVLGERTVIVAAGQPPNLDGLDGAGDRLWAAAVTRWFRPVVNWAYSRHYTEQPGDRSPVRSVVDDWWHQAALALRDLSREVVQALLDTFTQISRQPLDQQRDQLARVLRLDAFNQTTRNRVREIEQRLLDDQLSQVDLGAMFARRVRLETNLFLLEASQARAEGFKALETTAADEDKPALRDAARQASRPASVVRDAERELSQLDAKLYSGSQLDPAQVADLREKLRLTYGDGHADHETWRNNVTREARGIATAVLNAATLQRGLDEAQATGDEYVKRWFATLTDQRTRPTHLEANSQTVGLMEQFRVGEADLDHPGDFTAPPEERVNCRCSMWVGTKALHDTIASSLQAAGTTQEDNVTAVAAEIAQETGLPIGFRGVFAPLDRPTGDGRMLATPPGGEVRFRDQPWPMLWQEKVADGHDGAVVVGKTSKFWTEGDLIWGQGPFDLESPHGREAARLLHNRYINGLSIDPDDVIAEYNEADDLVVYKDWRIMGGTFLPYPAFNEARLEPVYATDLDLTLVASLQASASDGFDDARSFVASLEAGAVPGEPTYNADWFADPKLTEITPVTITPEGRVFGHAADKSVCHIGIGDMCVMAPRSRTGYAYFHVGEVITDRGPLAVGKITLAGGHASDRYGYRPATEHYDNSCSSVAVVRAYDDEFGVAIAGQIIHGVDPARVSEMRMHPPSGDWREVGGNLEMVGCLSVVVPGFPTPREDPSKRAPAIRAYVAGGKVVSLVAAGWVPPRAETVQSANAEAVAVFRRMERAKELRARIAPTQEQMKARVASLATRITPNSKEN